MKNRVVMPPTEDGVPFWDVLDKPDAKCDETNVLYGGEVMVTHRKDHCAGYWCPVHNPSPHHMAGWRQRYDFALKQVQRRCSHNNWHPDPDDKHTTMTDRLHVKECPCHCCDYRGHIKQRRIRKW